MASNLIKRLIMLGISPDNLQNHHSNTDSAQETQIPSTIAGCPNDRYNSDGRLTEAQKEFLTVLARISIRRLIKEVEKELEGETL